MSKLNLIVAIGVCFVCLLKLQNLSDAESVKLQLDHVVESVLNHHPHLLAAKTEIDVATANIKGAEGGFDPVIRFNSLDFIEGNYENSGYLDATIEQPTSLYGTRFIAGYRRSNDGLPPYYDHMITQNDGEVRAGIEVPILRDGAIDNRRAQLQKAQINQVIGTAAFDQRKIELVRGAKNAYYDWIAAGKKVKIVSDLLKVTRKRQVQLEERAQRGDISQFDVIDNQRSVLQRQSQLVSVERLFTQHKYELSLYYRDTKGEPIIPSDAQLPEKFPLIAEPKVHSISMTLEAARSQRPDLARLIALQRQTAVELELAKNQILPKLDAQFLVSQDLGTSIPKYDETDLRAGIRFEMPLFNRTAKGQAESLEAKAKELQSLQNYLEDKIAADLNDVIVGIRLASKRIEVSSNELVNAKKVESGERERFEYGDSNLIFVNLREQASADAAIRVVDAKLELLKASAALEAITASSLEK